jgi:hypothetical protein
MGSCQQNNRTRFKQLIDLRQGQIFHRRSPLHRCHWSGFLCGGGVLDRVQIVHPPEESAPAGLWRVLFRPMHTPTGTLVKLSATNLYPSSSASARYADQFRSRDAFSFGVPSRSSIIFQGMIFRIAEDWVARLGGAVFAALKARRISSFETPDASPSHKTIEGTRRWL